MAPEGQDPQENQDGDERPIDPGFQEVIGNTVRNVVTSELQEFSAKILNPLIGQLNARLDAIPSVDELVNRTIGALEERAQQSQEATRDRLRAAAQPDTSGGGKAISGEVLPPDRTSEVKSIASIALDAVKMFFELKNQDAYANPLKYAARLEQEDPITVQFLGSRWGGRDPLDEKLPGMMADNTFKTMDAMRKRLIDAYDKGEDPRNVDLGPLASRSDRGSDSRRSEEPTRDEPAVETATLQGSEGPKSAASTAGSGSRRADRMRALTGSR